MQSWKISWHWFLLLFIHFLKYIRRSQMYKDSLHWRSGLFWCEQFLLWEYYMAKLRNIENDTGYVLSFVITDVWEGHLCDHLWWRLSPVTKTAWLPCGWYKNFFTVKSYYIFLYFDGQTWYKPIGSKSYLAWTSPKTFCFKIFQN